MCSPISDHSVSPVSFLVTPDNEITILSDVIDTSSDDSWYSVRSGDQMNHQYYAILDNNVSMASDNAKDILADKDYQLSCLKTCLDVLRSDKTGSFKTALKVFAQKTLGSDTLPSTDNICPIIRFDARNEPHFDFHFFARELCLKVKHCLASDPEIINLSKIIYSIIIDDSKVENSVSEPLKVTSHEEIAPTKQVKDNSRISFKKVIRNVLKDLKVDDSERPFLVSKTVKLIHLFRRLKVFNGSSILHLISS